MNQAIPNSVLLDHMIEASQGNPLSLTHRVRYDAAALWELWGRYPNVDRYTAIRLAVGATLSEPETKATLSSITHLSQASEFNPNSSGEDHDACDTHASLVTSLEPSSDRGDQCSGVTHLIIVEPDLNPFVQQDQDGSVTHKKTVEPAQTSSEIAKPSSRMSPTGAVAKQSPKPMSRSVSATAHGYSPRRRSVMWNIGDPMIKCSIREGKAISPYGQIYLDRKAYEVARNPEIKPIHAHRRAQRYMEKRLLKDLWKEWKSENPRP